MAQLVPAKRVTIFADRLLEDVVLQQLEKLGATGFTCTDCRGAGTHRVVQDLSVIAHRVRIETIVTAEIAGAIIDFIESPVFSARAFTACVETVEIPVKVS
ncbi:MAG: hypothetical protein JSS02_33950 [Planctomycetes bacterium]|nr:hypothetical protein [Planctomycetota bacterium]